MMRNTIENSQPIFNHITEIVADANVNKIPYCLKLRPVSYKCLVSFSGWEKQHYNKNERLVSNKCRVFCVPIIIILFKWYFKAFSFPPSPSNMTDVGQQTTKPHRVIKYHLLYITVTATSLCGLAGRLLLKDKLLAITQIYIHGDQQTMLSISWCTESSESLHERCQLPLEFITQKTLIENLK